MSNKKIGSVLVVGGGIGGMQASLDLVESGFKVYLLERLPSIGGVMSQLDKTFPTNDCAMCTMAPKLVETGRHLNIDVITNADLGKVSGKAGCFEVEIVKHPRFIDQEKCTGCGVCAEECPIDAINEYNQGLNERRAVYMRYPQAVPRAFAIDRTKCIGCGLCENLCLRDAVMYNDAEKIDTLRVGSIILAIGFEGFNPLLKHEYGYRRYPNVLSSIEFERILSASGPYKGHVFRPSDGKIPERIAWIQCVGSRDFQVDRSYCSSVCCTYAVKQAIIAKEHIREDLSLTIFNMDLRTFGKGFEEYYNWAKDEYGVNFVKGRVSRVFGNGQDGNLTVRFTDEHGKIKTDNFDLVVLSVGLTPNEGVKKLAKRLGIKLNEFGFIKTTLFSPLETSRPGIFVAGAFQGPKDIPETVMQGSGVASKTGGLIAEARGTEVLKKTYPPEIDASGQPRIGVFVCHCGINIGGVVDVPSVVEYARTLPNVVYAEHNLYTCSEDTQKKIRQKIEEERLNRVVVASCTPRTHEPLFRDTCRNAGLNPYLFEMANIRDQCSWVHMNEPEKATRKAKDLVRIAVAKSRLLEPLYGKTLKVNRNALVIGGGVSGMQASLDLAEQGFQVYLVEKGAELGGNLRHIHYLLDGSDPKGLLTDLIDRVNSSENITVYLNTSILKVDGSFGNFKTTIELRTPNSEFRTLEHGVIIVATGAEEYKPTEYLYGQDPRVITQRQFEERLWRMENKEETHPSTVVMIQCVGSREKDRPYCSRICCQQAIKNALKIKEISPQTNVYILYRDMRSYGFNETYYAKAREEGVIFIRYNEDQKPEVKLAASSLEVSVFDPIIQKQLSINPDLLVLSVAILPNPGNKEIGQIFKVPIDQNGFFLEAHMKLRPVDFATEGIYMAGLAHGPKTIDESIAQASAAAGRATTILSKDEIILEAALSFVVDENCDGCAYCIDPCPYKALTLIEYMKDGAIKKTVESDESKCKGCGVCMATCPKKGIYVRHFKLEMLQAMVEAALQPVS